MIINTPFALKNEEVYYPKHVYIFKGDCVVCKKPQEVTVDAKELHAFNQGGYIQDSLSNNENEREFLMSGICGPCYDKMFAYEEDETEE